MTTAILAPIFAQGLSVELTPTDYINAVRIYSNKYLVADPTTQEVVLGFGDFEYALVWRGEDQCFFPRFGRIVSPEDSQMFRLVARHWRKMDKKSQDSWMQTICQILNIEYEADSSSSEDSSDEMVVNEQEVVVDCK